MFIYKPFQKNQFIKVTQISQHYWQRVKTSVANDWPEFLLVEQITVQANHFKSKLLNDSFEAVHKSDWTTLSDCELLTWFLNTKMALKNPIIYLLLMCTETNRLDVKISPNTIDGWRIGRRVSEDCWTVIRYKSADSWPKLGRCTADDWLTCGVASWWQHNAI